MEALASRGTWELIATPTDTVVVGFRWVFTLKYHPDGSNDRYKARLVAKSYTQTYSIDYFETFPPIAKINSIKILFSIVVNLSWSLFQLDVNNTLYGDLQEEVYIEQPPSYVAQGETKVCHLKKAIHGLKQNPMAWFEKFSLTISGICFHRFHLDHSIFIRRIRSSIVVLVVYVDDILLTGSDSAGIVETKMYLKRHFVTKDMGRPKYFLRIEVAHQKYSVLISQR